MNVESGAIVATLTGPVDSVWCVAFSTDGRKVGSAGADGEVRIWDLKTGQQLFESPAQNASVWAVAFDRTGKYLASAGETVSLWDIVNGGNPKILRGTSEIVAKSVAFSPSDEFLASGDADGFIRIWRVPERKEARVLRGHGGAVKSICFSSDGRRIASAGSDGKVRLWDLQSGQELRSLRGHDSGVRSVSFTLRDERLVSAADDSVRLWNTETGQQIRTLSVPYNPIHKVEFSGDGGRLALLDQNVRILDVKPVELSTLGTGEPKANDVAFSADGRHLASAHRDRTIRIWDMKNGRQLLSLQGFTGDPQSVVMSADGHLIAVGDSKSEVHIWELASKKESRLLKSGEGGPNENEPIKKIAFTADSRHLVSISYHHISKWDVAKRNKTEIWKVEQRYITRAEFNSGQSLMAVAAEGKLSVWDIVGNRKIHTFPVDASYGLAFTFDARSLATASSNNRITIWDLGTGEEVRAFEAHDASITSLAFAPNGGLLASGSADGTVCFWEVATGKLRGTLIPGAAGWVFHSATGQYKVSGNLDGRYWYAVNLCRFEVGELDPFLPDSLIKKAKAGESLL